MTDEIKAIPGGGVVFAGKDAVSAFRAVTIASGLRLYAKTGMKPNRMWSPSAMLKAASQITGKTYKRTEYVKAADDLKLWADTMAAALPKGEPDTSDIPEAGEDWFKKAKRIDP